MMRRHYIMGSVGSRPESAKTVFCDGSADESFRDSIDLELSHWLPNRTPNAYRADTSTAICLKFAADPLPDDLEADWDLVINNHADVDGILAVFSVVEPSLALEHRRTLIEAAEMGDFWAWGGDAARLLFQALVLLIQDLATTGTDPSRVYSLGFERIRSILSGDLPDDSRIAAGQRSLQESFERVDTGVIERQLLSKSCAQYVVPKTLGSSEAALVNPVFNEPLSDRCLLWPHARARLDAERVHLISVERDEGWHHDVAYPGYMWADTVTRWRAPGLRFTGSSNVHHFDHPPLAAAFEALQTDEKRPGKWTLAERLTPFESIEGRGFPVVASFLRNGRSAPSSQNAEDVAARLAGAFSAATARGKS